MKEQKSVIPVAKYSYRLVKLERECPQCHGTFYRVFDDGTLECVKCQTPVIKVDAKAENP